MRTCVRVRTVRSTFRPDQRVADRTARGRAGGAEGGIADRRRTRDASAVRRRLANRDRSSSSRAAQLRRWSRISASRSKRSWSRARPAREAPEGRLNAEFSSSRRECCGSGLEDRVTGVRVDVIASRCPTAAPDFASVAVRAGSAQIRASGAPRRATSTPDAAALLLDAVERWRPNACSLELADGSVRWRARYPNRFAAPGLRWPSNALRRLGRTTRTRRAGGLAVLVLVRHAACFAALFVGWASWGDYAQDAHCLQSQ